MSDGRCWSRPMTSVTADQEPDPSRAGFLHGTGSVVTSHVNAHKLAMLNNVMLMQRHQNITRYVRLISSDL